MQIVQWLAKSILSVLAWLIVAIFVLFFLGRCQSESASPSKMGRPVLDLARPVQTDSFALVCPKSLLLSGELDRRQSGVLEQVRDLYSSMWNVEQKAKALGCERWRAGIRVYNFERLGGYVAFTVSPDIDARHFFTVSAYLVNEATALGASGTNAVKQDESMRVGGASTSKAIVGDATHCYKEGDMVSLTGMASEEALTMADDSVGQVTIWTLDEPVCVRSMPISSASEDEAEVHFTTRFQLIGRGGVPSARGQVRGRLSTDNVSQYYAVPDAINVDDGSRSVRSYR